MIMKSYVAVYGEDGMLIVGPFRSKEAAKTWGGKRPDSQWFVLPNILVEDYGMLGDEPIDQPFAAFSVVSPKIFPEVWVK